MGSLGGQSGSTTTTAYNLPEEAEPFARDYLQLAYDVATKVEYAEYFSDYTHVTINDPTVTCYTTGGAIAWGVYNWIIVAIDASGGHTAKGKGTKGLILSNTGRAVISWGAVEGAVCYKVYRGKQRTIGNPNLSGNGAIGSLGAGTYRYQLEAIDEEGCLARTGFHSIRIDGIDDTAIKIEWDLWGEDLSWVSYYRVVREDPYGEIVYFRTTQTSFNDDGTKTAYTNWTETETTAYTDYVSQIAYATTCIDVGGGVSDEPPTTDTTASIRRATYAEFQRVDGYYPEPEGLDELGNRGINGNATITKGQTFLVDVLDGDYLNGDAKFVSMLANVTGKPTTSFNTVRSGLSANVNQMDTSGENLAYSLTSTIAARYTDRVSAELYNDNYKKERARQHELLPIAITYSHQSIRNAEMVHRAGLKYREFLHGRYTAQYELWQDEQTTALRRTEVLGNAIRALVGSQVSRTEPFHKASPLMGMAGGAMAGLATGNPWGVAAGAALGLAASL